MLMRFGVLFISLFFYFSVLAQNSAKPSSVPVVKEHEAAMNPWLKSIEQAEAVERELLKLIFKESELPAKSFFGKTKSAWLKLLNKKHGVTRYACQSYELSKSDNTKYTLLETCIPKVRPEIIFIEFSGPDQLRLTFYLQQLSDLVGFAAPILKSSFTCELSKKGSDLKKINCIEYVYSKKPEEILKLESLVYQKDEKNNLTAQGKLFYEMLPEKSVDVVVPKEGKVFVTVKVIQRYREPAPSPKNPPNAKEPGEYNSARDQKGATGVVAPVFGAQEPGAAELPGAARVKTPTVGGGDADQQWPEARRNRDQRLVLPPAPELPIDQPSNVNPQDIPLDDGSVDPAGGVRRP